jgi:hypothetical protein
VPWFRQDLVPPAAKRAGHRQKTNTKEVGSTLFPDETLDTVKFADVQLATVEGVTWRAPCYILDDSWKTNIADLKNAHSR